MTAAENAIDDIISRTITEDTYAIPAELRALDDILTVASLAVFVPWLPTIAATCTYSISATRNRFAWLFG